VKVLRISPASRALLDAQVLPGKVPADPVRAPDGVGFLISVDEEVFARLAALSDDPDEAIRLACTGHLGRA